MKAEERIAELEEQVAARLAEKAAWQAQEQERREQLGQALTHIAQVVAGIHGLEGQGKQDSHNSSKPPSSDGWVHQRRRQRKASGKPSGGQSGPEGHHLPMGARADEIVAHRPSHCQHCQQESQGQWSNADKSTSCHTCGWWSLNIRAKPCSVPRATR